MTGQIERTYTGLAVGGPALGSAVTDTVYSYDTLGRLDSVTVNERFDNPLSTPEVTDYVYDLVGNLAQTRMANGVVTDYEYDGLNRLDLLRHFNDDGDYVYETGPSDTDVLLSEFDYTVRADGKRTRVVEHVYDGSSTTTTTQVDWLYDKIGRLTREIYDSPVGGSDPKTWQQC